MASSSSKTTQLYANAVTEKLSKSNHAMWKAQILAALRGSRLIGHVTGKTSAPSQEIDSTGADGKAAKVPNPEFEEWYASDQQVLGFLLASLSREVLVQVSSKETAAEAWREIESMFSSQTRARAVNTCLALATTQKGHMTVAEYVGKMKALGDEMAAAGRPLEEEELIEYILAGLDLEFNPVVTSLVARTKPVSIAELYSQLLAFETRVELMGGGNSSVNAANRGRGAPYGRGNGDRGDRRDRGDRGRGRADQARPRGPPGAPTGGNQRQGPPNYRRNMNDKRPLCQVCHKKGHTADRCWHRYDEDYVPDERQAAAASTTRGNDHYWVTDSGATDHITGDLEKLAVRDKYNGGDHIHTASGQGSGHTEHST